MNQDTHGNTALIVMAHGSRQAAANQEFEALVQSINQQGLAYTSIHHCFLELAQPRLLNTIQKLVKNSITTIDVYPLFFNQGNHVQRDIPEQITKAAQEYPQIKINTLDYFGSHPLLSDMIAGHITQKQRSKVINR